MFTVSHLEVGRIVSDSEISISIENPHMAWASISSSLYEWPFVDESQFSSIGDFDLILSVGLVLENIGDLISQHALLSLESPR